MKISEIPKNPTHVQGFQRGFKGWLLYEGGGEEEDEGG
jgi:hypothetical protein